MARGSSIDGKSIVERELSRLSRANMPISEFIEQAELTPDEQKAVYRLFSQKSDVAYVDATIAGLPVAMVGTYEGGE